MRQIASETAPPTYQRHRPERTVLYSIISEHYPHLVQAIELSGGQLPQFVRQEFEDYLKCGLLEHGFLRIKWRQWVLTFPFPLRFLLAANPQALTDVLGVVQRGTATFLTRQAGFTVPSGAKTGAVTLIQRFGSTLNLNPHLHMLFLDEAYRFGGNEARFHRARRATHDQLVQLLDTLSRRIVRVNELAIGPHAGRKALTLYSVPPLVDKPTIPLLAVMYGFSLHRMRRASAQQAGTAVPLHHTPADKVN